MTYQKRIKQYKGFSLFQRRDLISEEPSSRLQKTEDTGQSPVSSRLLSQKSDAKNNPETSYMLSSDSFPWPANIMTIPSGHDFLDLLAEGIFTSMSEQEAPLQNWLLFLPTRRAIRVLEQKLLERSKQKAFLLPNLQTLADVEESEFFFEPAEITHTLPPAISELQRQFELSALIKAREAALGHSLDNAAAFALTRPLIQLMDEMDREGIQDLSALDGDFKEILPVHLSQAADFLKIINEAWPQRLKTLGMMNPVARRMQSLLTLAGYWRKNPPKIPILAAGSTASTPATAEILSVIARSRLGCVILPGFDQEIDEKAWQAIGVQHPQMAMKAFLEHTGCRRDQIRLFPLLSSIQENLEKERKTKMSSGIDLGENLQACSKEKPENLSPEESLKSENQQQPESLSLEERIGLENRHRLIKEALRPAETTQDWQERLKTLWIKPASSPPEANTHTEITSLSESKYKFSVDPSGGERLPKNNKQSNPEFIEKTLPDIKTPNPEITGFTPVLQALQGLSLVEAPTEEKEALIIALALREAMETEQKTAILVCPNTGLAKRVAACLLRWNILPDSSLGESILGTGQGMFFLALLDWRVHPLSPIALLTLLQNPLSHFGIPTHNRHQAVQFLDRYILRGVFTCQNYQELQTEIQAFAQEKPDSCDTEILNTVKYLIQTLGKFLTEISISASESQVSTYTQHLVEMAEEITRDTENKSKLWQNQEGHIFTRIFKDMITYGNPVALQSWRVFLSLFKEVFQEQRVRIPWGTEKRIQILGVLEARLLSADLIILAGLNEGVWPQNIPEEPFLSYPMRSAIGLSVPEKRLGLMAHDFVQLISFPKVLLTRSEQKNGNPVLASRWLWRLKALISGAFASSKIEKYLQPETNYLALARNLDRVAQKQVCPALPPEPRPPLSARWPAPEGRRLSVTDLKVFIRDPYAIYARRILGLKPLEPLEKSAGALEWGIAFHQVLEKAAQEVFPGKAGEQNATIDSLAQQKQDLYIFAKRVLMKAGFPEAELVLESEGLKKSIQDFLLWESARRNAGIQPLFLEAKGVYTLDLPTPFEIRVRADRLDQGPEGIDIIDYKTGTVPTLKEIKEGFDLQLPIEAAILMQNGFLQDKQHPAQQHHKLITTEQRINQIFYLQFSSHSGMKQKWLCKNSGVPAKDFTPEQAILLAHEKTKEWIQQFEEPEMAYQSQAHAKYVHQYGDYNVLARRKEWNQYFLQEEE